MPRHVSTVTPHNLNLIPNPTMDVYAENILDHYRHPRNKNSEFRIPNSEFSSHTEENLSCGDTVTIHLSIKDDRIAEISWDGTGCAISQAAMSLLSEELAGKTVSEVEALIPKDIYDILGVPIGPRRVKCALLGLHTLKNALRKNVGKELQSWIGTVGTT
ncbi:MAG: iron-sulfur cluster assembly scaffold protein [Patescibacteria group bacterium]